MPNESFGDDDVHRRAMSNLSADGINNHVSEIINDVGENLLKTTIDVPHAHGGTKVTNPDIKSNSVMLVKETPHGRDENLIVNSENYTRE